MRGYFGENAKRKEASHYLTLMNNGHTFYSHVFVFVLKLLL